MEKLMYPDIFIGTTFSDLEYTNFGCFGDYFWRT